LAQECVFRGHIAVQKIVTRGDFVVVADLMKSISLLIYKTTNGPKLEEIARDYNANMMTAAEMLDQDIYIGAESECNLFTVRRNTDATTDEEASRLETIGYFHLGDTVNQFRHGIHSKFFLSFKNNFLLQKNYFFIQKKVSIFIFFFRIFGDESNGQ
jgi:DNA damage-binding protein 1